MDKNTFVFGGIVHAIDIFLRHARSGPSIRLELKDIAGLTPADPNRPESQREPYAQPEYPAGYETEESTVLFYKQFGKYTVIHGRTQVEKLVAAGVKTIKGNLVTKHMLKHAEVIPPEARPSLEPAYQDRPFPRYQQDAREDRGFNSSYRNRPAQFRPGGYDKR